MSNLNNKSTTNFNQSVSLPGSSVPPSFLQILRVQSQLTNTPISIIQIDPPNEHQIYYDIHPDSNRHKRAFTQKFYIVDSPVKGIKHPTIYMVGNTSLLYTLRFTSCGIFCNCPDVNPACKHIRFMLRISGLPSSYTKVISYPIEQIIRQLHITDISEYKLDPVTSSICMASLNKNCNICNKHIIKDFLMCDKGNSVFHLMCTKPKNNRQYLPKNIGPHNFQMYRTKHKTKYRHPLTSTSTRICSLCKKPWTPILIPIKNKYINLHDLLQSKGYISGVQPTDPFLATTVAHTSNTLELPEQTNPFLAATVAHTSNTLDLPEQNNPFLAATVAHTSNRPLRTNSRITSPANSKLQKPSYVQTLSYKTPPQSQTLSPAHLTHNDGNSLYHKKKSINSIADVTSEYI